ncbi:MAG: hypothetical protein M1832_005480 [Thelocarpon impressellum]|nr:MAG: hypothetical protein M1832_005480 [Thelocarpon impressellum]
MDVPLKVVPQLEAGGGIPSALSSSKKLETLSPDVIKHLKAIFSSIAGGDSGLDQKEADVFLRNMQGTDPSEGGPLWPDKEKLDFHDFLHYASLPDFRALGPPVSYDLSYPLSNYFISSSHNTYLTGHQLYGQSSTDGYKSIVDHPLTVRSDLPVIVSLELHVSLEQQEVMVDIMQETWGDLLVDRPKCNSESDNVKLPTPAELRRKILLKVKNVSEKKPAEGATDGTLAPAQQRVDSLSSSSSSDAEASTQNEGQAKKAPKIIQALSKLGVYTRSFHFSNLLQPEASIPTHVFSLSEKKFMDMHETHAPGLFHHNRSFLMRAYPMGLRVSSSNLDPSVFWRKGVQMVALNWQKWDEGMMLNEGMFAGEGGWVLKPPGYRSVDVPEGSTAADDTVGQAEAIAHKTLDLTVEVFAGQDIPLPPGDDSPKGFHPYVKIELHVEKPEERSGKPIEGGGKSKGGEYKRRTKTRKGIEPDFKGEALQFVGVPGVVEELSFVRLKIHDDEIGKDELAAWACIRLDRLRQGYRFVSLLDARGMETAGVVLVKITKSTVLPQKSGLKSS